MDQKQTHSSIQHLLNQGAPLNNPTAVASNNITAPTPVAVGLTKEAGPSVSKVEHPVEDARELERPPEQKTTQEAKKVLKPRHNIPDIHPDAAKAGLQVAPSASPFPTIYDITVPVLKDEEIEVNLHKSFWTGARWLAELCKYMLWQAHIRLRRVGNKIVRERVPQRF